MKPVTFSYPELFGAMGWIVSNWNLSTVFFDGSFGIVS